MRCMIPEQNRSILKEEKKENPDPGPGPTNPIRNRSVYPRSKKATGKIRVMRSGRSPYPSLCEVPGISLSHQDMTCHDDVIAAIQVEIAVIRDDKHIFIR